MIRTKALFALIVLAVFAAPAAAATPLSFGRYWSGFKGFWIGIFGSVSGVVGLALVVGVISVFIITRGKWMK